MRRAVFGSLIICGLLLAGVTWAGVGIHVGMDMTKVEAAQESFSFENDSNTLSYLRRDATNNPINAGIDLTFTMIPVIDLQLSLEAAFESYVVDVWSDVPGASTVDRKEIPYLRIGGDLSALVELGSFPPMVGIFKPFIGGGIGLHAFGPVVSEELLTSEVKSATEEIKPEDYISVDPKLGFHLLFGIKVKPGPVPLGLRLTGKYYIFTDQAADTPDNFLTIQAGLYLGG